MSEGAATRSHGASHGRRWAVALAVIVLIATVVAVAGAAGVLKGAAPGTKSTGADKTSTVLVTRRTLVPRTQVTGMLEGAGSYGVVNQAATIVIGAAAGLLPALRTARLSPTEALWSL